VVPYGTPTRVCRFRDASGAVTGAVLVATDITELYQGPSRSCGSIVTIWRRWWMSGP